MEHPQIKIETNGTRTKVFVNGSELRDVYAIRFSHEVGGVAKMELAVNALNVSLDADMLPSLPEPWASWYVPKEVTE